MSLFGSSPPADSSLGTASAANNKSSSNSLFTDDDASGGGGSPWDMPTPRKQQSRADLLRNLLPASDAPDSYVETFDKVVRDDGDRGKVTAGGIAKVFAAARLEADQQAHIMSIVAPGGGEVAVGRNEFNVLLALIGLAQEGESISLDAVDERRRNLPSPKLAGLTADPVMPPVSELAAKPPQAPGTPTKEPPSPAKPRTPRQAPMEYPDTDDPWGSPDLHKDHVHAASTPRTNGTSSSNHQSNGDFGFQAPVETAIGGRTMSAYTTATVGEDGEPAGQEGISASSAGGGGWGYFDGSTPSGGFNDASQGQPAASPFGGGGGDGGGGGGGNGDQGSSGNTPGAPMRPSASGRTGSGIEEHIVISLMPEKEGMFLFQHHNYEVSSARRGSKVIRRYSDFVWLLDCLHKRYPFRVLPLLPPKRMAVNGNHLSNDGAFIEKRRRGLGRFLNALVRHPILGQEQLVVMFLTVPTELTGWRKQATISVQDEFDGRALPPGLEDSLPSTLEELFDRTRSGVRRSAELYINACNIMDRLVKRSEGVAADHARIAVSLHSLTETSNDTYATDTNDVPLLNDGLAAMGKHLRTCQSLMEDESKAWDAGVLEDLKRQRDSLVSVREMFERRERLDKDNIPYLERRIQTNEAKLASLRNKPDGMVKPGEIEKVVEAIIKDKESIVSQHNRSIFVKECIRDELLYFQSTQYHVSRWNQDWAQERAKYAELLADNWRRLLDDLEGMPLGD